MKMKYVLKRVLGLKSNTVIEEHFLVAVCHPSTCPTHGPVLSLLCSKLKQQLKSWMVLFVLQ